MWSESTREMGGGRDDGEGMGSELCWRVFGCPNRAPGSGEEPGLSWQRRKELFGRLTGHVISLISA